MARTMAQANAPSGTTISGPISINPLGASAVCGYRELYLRSLAQRARGVHGSIVRPYRLTRDRQPESGAARSTASRRVRSNESLKESRALRHVDTFAVVGDRDDRGQVAGDPPQRGQRGEQAVAAAERDDPAPGRPAPCCPAELARRVTHARDRDGIPERPATARPAWRRAPRRSPRCGACRRCSPPPAS